MQPVLRLHEDVLSNDAAAAWPARPRIIFAVHGSAAIADRELHDDEAWSGEGAIALKAGRDGATLWRWELVAGEADGGPAAGAGIVSREKLAARLETLPKGERSSCAATASLSTAGGCAYRHRHQGPGIRCLIEGGIRIDTHGRSTSYGPGGAWYESGARTGVRAGRGPAASRFIRVMILPRAVSGKKLGRVSERGG